MLCFAALALCPHQGGQPQPPDCGFLTPSQPCISRTNRSKSCIPIAMKLLNRYEATFPSLLAT